MRRYCKVTQESIEDGLFHNEPARVGEQVAEENQHIEFPEKSSADLSLSSFPWSDVRNTVTVHDGNQPAKKTNQQQNLKKTLWLRIEGIMECTNLTFRNPKDMIFD